MRAFLQSPVGASALLVVLCAAVWGPLVAAEFSNDDELLIVNNLYIRDFAYLLDNLTRDYFFNSQGSSIGYWRPLTKATYMVDWAIWGANPGGYYAVNIALFAGTILLAARVMLRMGAPVIVAYSAAALAAVHPAHAQSIGVITSRSDLLVALFLLVVVWIELRPEPKRFDVPLGLLATAAALGSKEVGVIAPVLVAIVHVTARGESWRDVPRIILPYVGLVGMYGMLRLSLGIAPQLGIHHNVDTAHLLLAAGKAAGIYTARLALPASVDPIVAYAVFPRGPDAGTLAWCALAAAGGLLLVALLLRRKFWLPVALIALPIAPALQLRYVTVSVHPDWLPVFDRGLVLPAIGSAWLIAAASYTAAGWLRERGVDGRWVVTVGALWWLAASFGAVEAVAASKTPESRFRPFIEEMESIPPERWAPFQRRFVLEDRGRKQAAAGDFAAAERTWQELLSTDPTDPVAKVNLAIVYRKTGRPRLAIDTLRSILEGDGTTRSHRHRKAIWIEIARAEADMGNEAGARRALEEAQRLDGRSAQ